MIGLLSWTGFGAGLVALLGLLVKVRFDGKRAAEISQGKKDLERERENAITKDKMVGEVARGSDPEFTDKRLSDGKF